MKYYGMEFAWILKIKENTWTFMLTLSDFGLRLEMSGII